MSKIEDGGSAFPSEQHETQDGTWNQTFDPGMSLRDWFAGQALAGYFANPHTPHRDGHSPEIAEYMYAAADALLKARAAAVVAVVAAAGIFAQAAHLLMVLA